MDKLGQSIREIFEKRLPHVDTSVALSEILYEISEDRREMSEKVENYQKVVVDSETTLRHYIDRAVVSDSIMTIEQIYEAHKKMANISKEEYEDA
jgi:hypothetical protein